MKQPNRLRKSKYRCVYNTQQAVDSMIGMRLMHSINSGRKKSERIARGEDRRLVLKNQKTVVAHLSRASTSGFEFNTDTRLCVFRLCYLTESSFLLVARSLTKNRFDRGGIITKSATLSSEEQRRSLWKFVVGVMSWNVQLCTKFVFEENCCFQF